jgi:hypothetical protein
VMPVSLAWTMAVKAVQTVSPMTCSTSAQGTSPPGIEPSRLVEEAREATAAADEQLASELADVLEVLRALAKTHGVKWEYIELQTRRKGTERFGSDRRIFSLNTSTRRRERHWPSTVDACSKRSGARRSGLKVYCRYSRLQQVGEGLPAAGGEG